MWNLNLFGLDLVVVVRSLVVPSSLASEGLEEKKLQEVDNMLMVYRAALDLF